MNRRGDDTKVSPLIFAIVAIVVLVLGIIYILTAGSTLGEKFKNFIPLFGGPKPLVEGVEQIKYDIQKDTLAYYDGTSWIAFPSAQSGKECAVVLNDKKIKCDATQYFQNFYFNTPRPDFIAGGRLASYNATSPDKMSIFAFNNKISNDFPGSGGVGFRVVDSASVFVLSAMDGSYRLYMPIPALRVESTGVSSMMKEKTFRPFTDKLDGKKNYDEITLDNPNMTTIFNNAKAWRDSVLVTPMSFVYDALDNKGNVLKSNDEIYVCVKKYEDNALVADLTNPTLGKTC